MQEIKEDCKMYISLHKVANAENLYRELWQILPAADLTYAFNFFFP